MEHATTSSSLKSHNTALQVSGSILWRGLCRLKWPYCCYTATNVGARTGWVFAWHVMPRIKMKKKFKGCFLLVFLKILFKWLQKRPSSIDLSSIILQFLNPTGCFLSAGKSVKISAEACRQAQTLILPLQDGPIELPNSEKSHERVLAVTMIPLTLSHLFLFSSSISSFPILHFCFTLSLLAPLCF